jgi:APA family basic amino acid/polyamine antiporter
LIEPRFFFATNSDSFSKLITSNISPAFKEYIKAFGIGLVAVSFTYGGYQQTINFGAEVDKPSRIFPAVFFIGIFIIILLLSHHQLCLCKGDRI